MATTSGDRSVHYPAIEKKHGRPAAFWVQAVSDLGDVGYAEQMAFLRDIHGFSRAHANAIVMVARGSTSTRRYADPEAFFTSLGGDRERTARAVFAAIQHDHPDLELVIAWNQPMLKSGKDYVFGLSAATNHLLIASFASDAIEKLGSRLAGLETNSKTIRIPVDWEVDAALLDALVSSRLAEIG